MRNRTLSVRRPGELSGVSHTTVSRLLRSLVLCDIGTLATLETALHTDLWPGVAALPSASAASTKRSHGAS